MGDEELSFCEVRFSHVEFHNRHQLSFICESRIEKTFVFKQVEEGSVDGFLKATVTGYKDRDRIFYDIHGYAPITEVDLSGFHYEEWRELFRNILTVVQNGAEHVLEGEHIIFTPGYVYIHKQKHTVAFLYNEEYSVPFTEGITELAAWFLAHYHPAEDKTILLFFHFYHECAADCEPERLLMDLKSQVYLERDELLRNKIHRKMEELAVIAKEEDDADAEKRAESRHACKEGYIPLKKKLRVLLKYYLPEKKELMRLCLIVFFVCFALLLGGMVFGLFAMKGSVMLLLSVILVLSLTGMVKALTQGGQK